MKVHHNLYFSHIQSMIIFAIYHYKECNNINKILFAVISVPL